MVVIFTHVNKKALYHGERTVVMVLAAANKRVVWGFFVGVDLSDGFLFVAGTGLEDEDEVSDARRFGDEEDEEDEVAGEGDFEMDVARGFVMILRRE